MKSAIDSSFSYWQPSVCNKISIKRTTQLANENRSLGTSFRNMLTDCLWKLMKWINIPRQLVWENQSSGTNFLKSWQIASRYYQTGSTSSDKTTSCVSRILKWSNFPCSACLKNYLVCLVSCGFGCQSKRLLYKERILIFKQKMRCRG